MEGPSSVRSNSCCIQISKGTTRPINGVEECEKKQVREMELLRQHMEQQIPALCFDGGCIMCKVR
jgi:hypothetical protein